MESVKGDQCGAWAPDHCKRCAVWIGIILMRKLANQPFQAAIHYKISREHPVDWTLAKIGTHLNFAPSRQAIRANSANAHREYFCFRCALNSSDHSDYLSDHS